MKMAPFGRERLFTAFHANPPANPEAVAQCLSRLKFRPPDDYVRFLLEMNGGAGFIGKNFLTAWPVEELISTNNELTDGDPVPELFLFGSDGGGEGFAFDTRSIPPSIVVVPLIISLEDAVPLAANFDSFLQRLYHSESLFFS